MMHIWRARPQQDSKLWWVFWSQEAYTLWQFLWMRDVNIGFYNSVLPICMRRSCVWLLIRECIQEYSETKYEGKDQWLCFVPEAQKLQRCLDPYSRLGCCLILHPLFFGVTQWGVECAIKIFILESNENSVNQCYLLKWKHWALGCTHDQ
jgi:hypothetical protein